MKSIKQLLRRPVKLLAGILLVSLSVAILTVCIGQYTATNLTRENLDDRYDTIGLLSDAYFWEITEAGIHTKHDTLPEEYQNWVDETIQSRTDLIKDKSYTGLISAYIPDLLIDNFSRHGNGYQMSGNRGYPYRSAMLTVTLTEIGKVGTEFVQPYVNNGQIYEYVDHTTFLCTGTVESVVGLEQGFLSPVGNTIVLQITVPSKEAFDALDLKVGQTYLVYGQDYNHGDPTDFQGRIKDYRASYEQMFGKLYCKFGIWKAYDYEPMLAQFDCGLTLYDPAAFPARLPTFDQSGRITGIAASDQYEMHYWDGDQLKRKWISYEEYAPYYQLPTIAPLNGSVEEFLASEEGALWQEALDKMEINNHGFPVLCIDKLGYQAAFSREQARIVEGRDFTESELANGEKVCIISQSVASINGIQVGDTIDMRPYAYDLDLGVGSNQIQLGAWSMDACFPFAAFYSESYGFTSEAETYTIVGIYRQEDAWQNPYDDYGFTPNTIFVPKTSVTAETVTKDKGIYSTLVIENGKMAEFQALMEEAGYPDLFICYDQGYSEFVASLDAYEEVSEKALYIGIAGYAVLMLLFVVLFPAMQRKTLATMFSFGAPRRKRMQHILVSTAAVLLPGTVIGAFAGARLWTLVAAKLMQSLNIEIPLEANMPVIAPTLAAAHLLLMALVILFTAIILTKNNSIMKNK